MAEVGWVVKGWQWLGYPAHFLCAHSCAFHMATKVGKYIVSSVGDYRPDGMDKKKVTIGAGENSFFETYVFKAGGICSCGCGEPRIDSGCEIDGIRSATATEARKRHLAMCRKYAKTKAKK